MGVKPKYFLKNIFLRQTSLQLSNVEAKVTDLSKNDFNVLLNKTFLTNDLLTRHRASYVMHQRKSEI